MTVAVVLLATFRLQYEDEYEFSVLHTRFRFGGRKFSKYACSELKTRTRSRPRTAIWRSLFSHTCDAAAFDLRHQTNLRRFVKEHTYPLRFSQENRRVLWPFLLLQHRPRPNKRYGDFRVIDFWHPKDPTTRALVLISHRRIVFPYCRWKKKG